MDSKQDNTKYLSTLLQYFEEEIMGEAYFYGLTKHFEKNHEREKLTLLAQVERFAAESVRPLLSLYNLTPRTDEVLHQIAESWVDRHRDFEWPRLMADISVRYPGYLVEFHALEDMAPEEDIPSLNILTDHEVVAIEFANKEIAGDTDSIAPLQRYLSAAVAPPV